MGNLKQSTFFQIKSKNTRLGSLVFLTRRRGFLLRLLQRRLFFKFMQFFRFLPLFRQQTFFRRLKRGLGYALLRTRLVRFVSFFNETKLVNLKLLKNLMTVFWLFFNSRKLRYHNYYIRNVSFTGLTILRKSNEFLKNNYFLQLNCSIKKLKLFRVRNFLIAIQRFNLFTLHFKMNSNFSCNVLLPITFQFFTVIFADFKDFKNLFTKFIIHSISFKCGRVVSIFYLLNTIKVFLEKQVFLKIYFLLYLVIYKNFLISFINLFHLNLTLLAYAYINSNNT